MNQMKDAELKLNASGYYDETCYKGITAPPQPGEIWSNQDGTRYWLILQTSDKVCSTLQMSHVQNGNTITVLVHEPMYTDPIMVGYTYMDKLGSFVRKLKGNEYAEVQRRVGNALGITAAIENPLEDKNQLIADVKALSEKLVSLQFENNELKHENADLRKENEKLLMDHNMAADIANDLHAESIELSREIDCLKIYKEMYLTILDKLISVKGGAASDQAGVF